MDRNGSLFEPLFFRGDHLLRLSSLLSGVRLISGFRHCPRDPGFLLGFLVIGPPFGLLAGALIDRIGARWVILSGIGLVGFPLIAMGFMSHFWEYQFLCVLEVMGYVLAGPIANQVLVSHWFQARRGRAMGFAYLGLGVGGAVAPPTINWLIHTFGWRHALWMVGAAILIILFPIGLFVTRSRPSDMALHSDGAEFPVVETASSNSVTTKQALRDHNFWLIVTRLGSCHWSDECGHSALYLFPCRPRLLRHPLPLTFYRSC